MSTRTVLRLGSLSVFLFFCYLSFLTDDVEGKDFFIAVFLRFIIISFLLIEFEFYIFVYCSNICKYLFKVLLCYFVRCLNSFVVALGLRKSEYHHKTIQKSGFFRSCKVVKTYIIKEPPNCSNFIIHSFFIKTNNKLFMFPTSVSASPKHI